MIALLALMGAAVALDASGPLPVPSDGDPSDPLLAWRPEAQRAGTLSFNTVFESAHDLLNVATASADGVDQQALLDNLMAMNLNLSWAPSRRWAVTLVSPITLSSVVEGVRQGAGFGDLQLAVPVGLKLPGRHRGLGLSVVSFAGLPTGDASQYLGEGGLTGGALLASGVRIPGFQFALNTGFEALPREVIGNLQGGPDLLANLVGTWQPRENLALHLEGLARAGLLDSAPVPDSVSGLALARSVPCSKLRTADTSPCGEATSRASTSDTPVQVALGVRARVLDRLTLSAGGTLGLSNGVGAPGWSGYVGVGWSPTGTAGPGTGRSGRRDEEEEEAEQASQEPAEEGTTADLGPSDPSSPTDDEDSSQQEVELPELDTSVQDLACDGSGQTKLSAELSGGSGYTLLSTTWTDQDGGEVGHDPELEGVEPGVYTVTVTYEEDESGQRHEEERELSVGYALSWAEGENVDLSDGVRKNGVSDRWDAVARAANLLPAGEEGWVELEVGTAASTFGLVRQWSPAAAATDAGWRTGAGVDAVAGGETVGQGAGERLRVSRQLDGSRAILVWTADGEEIARTGADLDQAMEIGAALKAPGSALGVTRASFGCRADDALEYGYGDGGGSDRDVAIRVQDHTLRLILRARGPGEVLTLTFFDEQGVEVASARVKAEVGLNRVSMALRDGKMGGDGTLLDWEGDARDAVEVELRSGSAVLARQWLRAAAVETGETEIELGLPPSR